jgi:hypothetical protein
MKKKLKKARNLVAKHMNTYCKPSVTVDKKKEFKRFKKDRYGKEL